VSHFYFAGVLRWFKFLLTPTGWGGGAPLISSPPTSQNIAGAPPPHSKEARNLSAFATL
jgi:hypothetical protein